MQFEGYTIRTVADDPALEDEIQALIDVVWPAFIIDGHVASDEPPPSDWMGIYARWPQFQFVLYDADLGRPLAAGNACTLAWDEDERTLPDTGWHWEMVRAADDLAAARPARTLGALSITVAPSARSRGLSAVMVRAMKELGRRAGINRMIAPVRPTRKAEFPNQPIEEYMARTTAQGLAFDPWLRTHQRLGARIAGPCRRSMQIVGTVDEWQRWTGMEFPTSGAYAFPGGLAPVAIDRAADRGHYVEPNVWMTHLIA